MDGLRQDRQGPVPRWTVLENGFLSTWELVEGIEGSDRRQRSKAAIEGPETLEGPGHDGMAWALVGSSGLWALGSGLWVGLNSAFERP